MKVTKVSTAVIEANYDWTLVRIETDQGLTGIGEAFLAPGLVGVLGELSPLLVGEDPTQVGPLTRKLRLATAHASANGGLVHHAISGLEAALWDLSARALEVPLYRLLGGAYRTRIRVYADCHAGEGLESFSSILVSRTPAWAAAGQSEDGLLHWDPRGDGEYAPDAYVARAREMIARGFTALKFDLDLPRLPGEDLHARSIPPRQLERQIAIAAAVCEAAGQDVQVAFDCHWRYSPPDAVRLARALERYPVLWLEDPVPPENVEALARVTGSTTTSIASGENHYLASGFAPLLAAGALDVVAPDLQKVGGLAEGMRVADLADRAYLPVAPHNISGPVGTLASAHACAAIPNFLALEWHAATVPFFDSLVTAGGPLIKDGHIELTEAPGIGVELDLDECRRYAKAGVSFFA